MSDFALGASVVVPINPGGQSNTYEGRNSPGCSREVSADERGASVYSAAPARAVLRNMVDKYRQLGGPEKYLMETLARAFLGTAKFQIDQRTDLSQEKRRESIRKLKGLRPQDSKSA